MEDPPAKPPDESDAAEKGKLRARRDETPEQKKRRDAQAKSIAADVGKTLTESAVSARAFARPLGEKLAELSIDLPPNPLLSKIAELGIGLSTNPILDKIAELGIDLHASPMGQLPPQISSILAETIEDVQRSKESMECIGRLMNTTLRSEPLPVTVDGSAHLLEMLRIQTQMRLGQGAKMLEYAERSAQMEDRVEKRDKQVVGLQRGVLALTILVVVLMIMQITLTWIWWAR